MKCAEGYWSENLEDVRGTVVNGDKGYGGTDLATVGAMALQGPHQVAKASMTTTWFSFRTLSNCALL